MNTIKRFLMPARMAWRSLINITLYEIVVSLTGVGLIYGTQYIVSAIEQGDREKFLYRIYILIGITIFAVIIKILWRPYSFRVFRDLRDATDTLCLPQIINGDNNKYESVGTGRMIAIYGRGTMIWNNITINIFADLSGPFTLFVVFLVTIYHKDITMFWCSVGMIVLIGIRFYLFGRRQYKRRKLAKDRVVDIQRTQVRRFMNKYEIMQQDKVTDELEKRYELNRQWYHAKWREKLHQSFAFDSPIFISTLLFIFLVYYTGNQILSGEFSYSDLVVIVGLGLAVIRDLDGIMKMIRIIIDNWVDITRLRDLIDDVKTPYDIDTGKSFQLKIGKIDFLSVSYKYRDGSKVFDQLTLHIAGGKKTALVGMSGSGKTTLAKLISGYIRPDEGSVVIDGQDLKHVSLKSYYKHIGYLTQDPSVFDGSILENLTYALKEKVTRAQLDKVIEQARCEFIYTLPHGIETEIGERGVRLSGGQRQRLAIAKIFLKNPEIIILDEPTSALDSFSEEGITEAMHNLFQDRTVIIIAHRLQTVKEADDIIVLENGKVAERGKHDDLVKIGGAYAKMLELQSGF